MKEEILNVSKRLENNTIDTEQARRELCRLFSNNGYEEVWKGRAIVKSRNPNNKWIYEGSELPIIGLYMTHNNGFGIYPDGTREFRLSLVGTIYEKETGYTDTVIPETDLVILELEVE
jgi:hypothetical protein